MTTTTTPKELEFLIEEAIQIAAPIDTTFDALIEELTVNNHGGSEDRPMPMVLEARPGGRWYRDLGEENGHLWGFVQAIKRPSLLEIYGPLFMSSAVSNNLQYRLKETGGITDLTLRHSAFGIIEPGVREGVGGGWRYTMECVRRRAES